MSELRADAELARELYTNHNNSHVDQDEFIDLSGVHFDDVDEWLYVPKQCQAETTVHDLYTWLKSDPEPPLSANKKCIDTRTFTRPKKRSLRTSFESIFEAPSVSNVWKTQCSNFTNLEEDRKKCSSASPGSKEEIVPPMLHMAPSAASNLLSNEVIATSGQESMEVFLNMSQSKGIDSFINLTEPGFNDPLMNVSQPSIFYSSITSLPREDSLHNPDYEDDEKSVNLTQTIRLNKLDETRNLNNMNETFSKFDSRLNNKSFCISPIDRTFSADKSGTLEKLQLNETYDTEVTSKTLVISSTENRSTTNLSSTFVNKDDDSVAIEPQTKKETDSTSLDVTCHPEEIKKSPTLDSTYLSLNTEKNERLTMARGIDTHKEKPQAQVNRRSIINNETVNLPATPVGNSTFSSVCNNSFDSALKGPIPLCNQSTPKTVDSLNCTYKTLNKHLDSTRLYNVALCSNFKSPSSLRKELLAEIHRSSERRLDSTYNQSGNERFNEKDYRDNINAICDENVENDIPIENKYNTYKKESSTYRAKNQGEPLSDATASAQRDMQDRKYYTFTKRSAHGGKTDMENMESPDNVDSTFVKPFPKLQKKKKIPRMLSKLPQFLQKSNPNLVSSSLKAVNVTECGKASDMRYMKGSQPNIVRDVEKSVTNKLYSLGKMKSGSEQRLVELNTNAGDFQLLGAGGSTESIESTQSAHSAPDLDDRLSTCSDSSHNSYTAQTMNIEQLHQIVRMQEESLKQDTAPKLNRRVLENTWIDAKKDLPSPILKNGIDGFGSDSSSPLSIDFSVKTSSPILSPTGSSQSINTDSHLAENILKQHKDSTITKKIEVLGKPVPRIENRTRLRQPMNWNTGGRAPNVMSGIPRPPSRIPGPRFVRPTGKNIQGDVKRGYM